MRLSIKYWKNWNGTFGARVEIVSVEDHITDFPTRYIFRNDVIDIVNAFEKSRTYCNRATIDYQTLPTVQEWIEDTISDVRDAVHSYRSNGVPEEMVIVI